MHLLTQIIHTPSQLNSSSTPLHFTLASPLSERLRRLDLEIHEADHQERLVVDEDVTYH
jgi:hypothetical protein